MKKMKIFLNMCLMSLSLIQASQRSALTVVKEFVNANKYQEGTLDYQSLSTLIPAAYSLKMQQSVLPEYTKRYESIIVEKTHILVKSIKSIGNVDIFLTKVKNLTETWAPRPNDMLSYLNKDNMNNAITTVQDSRFQECFTPLSFLQQWFLEHYNISLKKLKKPDYLEAIGELETLARAGNPEHFDQNQLLNFAYYYVSYTKNGGVACDALSKMHENVIDLMKARNLKVVTDINAFKRELAAQRQKIEQQRGVTKDQSGIIKDQKTHMKQLSDSIKILQAEIAKHKDTIAKGKATIENLNAALVESVKVIEEQKNTIKTLHEKNVAQSEEFDKEFAILSRLSQDDKKRAVERLNKKLDVQKEKLIEQHRQIQTINSKNGQLVAQIATLKEEQARNLSEYHVFVEALESQIRNQQKSLEGQYAQSNEEKQRATEQLAECNREKQILTAQLEAAKKNFADQSDHAAAELASVKAVLDDAKQKYEADLKKHETDRKLLNAKNIVLKEKNIMLGSQLQAEVAKTKILEQQVEQLHAVIARNEEDIAANKETLKAFFVEIETLEEALRKSEEEFEAQMTELDAENEARKKRIEKFEASMSRDFFITASKDIDIFSAVRLKMINMDALLEQYGEQKSRSKEETAKLKAELASNEKMIQALQEELVASNESVKRLERSVEDQRKIIAMQRNHNDTLKASNAELFQKNQELMVELQGELDEASNTLAEFAAVDSFQIEKIESLTKIIAQNKVEQEALLASDQERSRKFEQMQKEFETSLEEQEKKYKDSLSQMKHELSELYEQRAQELLAEIKKLKFDAMFGPIFAEADGIAQLKAEKQSQADAIAQLVKDRNTILVKMQQNQQKYEEDLKKQRTSLLSEIDIKQAQFTQQKEKEFDEQLKAKIEGIQKAVDGHVNDLAAAKAKAEAEKANIEKELAQLKSGTQDAAKVKELEAANDAFRIKIETMTKSNLELTGIKSKLEAQRAELEKERKDFEVEHEKAKGESLQLKRKLAAKETELQKSEVEVATLKKTSEDNLNKYKALKKISTSEGLAEAAEDLVKLQNELDTLREAQEKQLKAESERDELRSQIAAMDYLSNVFKPAAPLTRTKSN